MVLFEANYLVDSDVSSLRTIEEVLKEGGIGVLAFSSGVGFINESSIADVGCVIVNLDSSTDQCPAIQKELLWRGSDLSIVLFSTSNRPIPSTCTSRQISVLIVDDPFNNDQLLVTVKAAIAKSHQRKAIRDHREEIRRRLQSLTESEKGVLDCLRRGLSHKNISILLDISPRSIDRRRKSVLEKMNVESLQELIAFLTEAQMME